ncbi:energy transducer TonB [Roseivirga sp. BDSF3-8]|uniref:energy transducer TonB n=1 Tax=Roseivirga sp. BDSF3-8 TaxID=3241598 RepID=UPI003531A9F4
MSILKANIPSPCHEDWDKMKPAAQSRYCQACRKHVRDFSQMDRPQTLTYLLTNKGEKTCGLLRKSQMNFTVEDLESAVSRIGKTSTNKSVAFYLLTLGSLLLAGCSDIQIDPRESSQEDTTMGLEEETEMPPLVGDIILDSGNYIETEPNDETGCFVTPEKMPEYPGGPEAMIKFMEEHLRYPIGLAIEGRSFISFTVQTDGTLTDIKVLKGFGENVDAGAVEVIRQMPAWIPGEEAGRKVPASMVVPIHYKLTK